MRKVAKTVAFALLATLSLTWVGLVSVQGPQALRSAWEALRLKLSGQASYVTWSQVLWYGQPNGFRPSGIRPIFRLEACSRVAIRMVTEGNGPCSTQWETPLGLFWADRQEGDLLAHMIEEQLVQAIYNRPPVAVHQGDVVVDGGAHIGTFSRFALSKGARKVIAFEPDPRNAECLKRNFEEELRQSRLVLVQKALWNTSGTLSLRRGTQSLASTVSEGTGAASELATAITIDDTVRELNLDRVDFIKLDIEGAERRAMASAAQTLRRFGRRTVLSTYHLPDDAVKITETVLRLRPSYWVFATAEQAYFYEPHQEQR